MTTLNYVIDERHDDYQIDGVTLVKGDHHLYLTRGELVGVWGKLEREVVYPNYVVGELRYRLDDEEAESKIANVEYVKDLAGEFRYVRDGWADSDWDSAFQNVLRERGEFEKTNPQTHVACEADEDIDSGMLDCTIDDRDGKSLIGGAMLVKAHHGVYLDSDEISRLLDELEPKVLYPRYLRDSLRYWFDQEEAEARIADAGYMRDLLEGFTRMMETGSVYAEDWDAMFDRALIELGELDDSDEY